MQNSLWDYYAGDQPIVPEPTEGLVITNLTAMGAASRSRRPGR